MKKVFGFLIGVLLASQVHAQDVSLSNVVASGHVDRAAVLGELGKVAIQPNVNVAVGDLSLGAWANVFAQDRDVLRDFDEIQLSASYAVAKNISVGISQDFTFSGQDSTQSATEITGSICLAFSLDPTITVAYNFADSERWDYDVYGSVGISKSHEQVSVSASVGVSNAGGKIGLHDVTGKASLDIPLGSITLSPCVTYTFVDSDTQHFVGGVGIGF